MLQRNSDQPYPVQEDTAGTIAEGWKHPTVDLREMGRILRRRFRLVALPPVVLVGLALVYVMVVTTLYTATSTVLVDPRRANVVETNQAVLSNFGTDDATIESQTLLIQSVAILERVVRKLKLTEDPEFTPRPGILDPIKQLFSAGGPSDGASAEDAARARSVEILQKRMKVTRQGTTFLVDINVSSELPQKAATIANAIADAYFEEQVRAKYDATRIAANWLKGQIDDLKSRVVASEKAVEDFRSANNLTVSQGVTVNDQQITDLNNKLIVARVQTAEARAKYDQVQEIAKSGGDPGGISAAISSEMIMKLRTQYADIAKNEADLSSKYGTRHPLVTNIRAQLRDTQRLINEEIRRILDSTQHDYDVARSREVSLKQSLDQLQGVSTSSGQAQVRLHELQREAEANRTLYESYLARSKETTAQESLEMPDSRIVTKASIPIRPSSPKTLLILGLALVLGLGAGSVLAFLADYLECTAEPAWPQLRHREFLDLLHRAVRHHSHSPAHDRADLFLRRNNPPLKPCRVGNCPAHCHNCREFGELLVKKYPARAVRHPHFASAAARETAPRRASPSGCSRPVPANSGIKPRDQDITWPSMSTTPISDATSPALSVSRSNYFPP
jgi:uncharacterized protein involved in exopolysaccharide biosynthesis